MDKMTGIRVSELKVSLGVIVSYASCLLSVNAKWQSSTGQIFKPQHMKAACHSVTPTLTQSNAKRKHPGAAHVSPHLHQMQLQSQSHLLS